MSIIVKGASRLAAEGVGETGQVLQNAIERALSLLYIVKEKEEWFLSLNHASSNPVNAIPLHQLLLGDSSRVLGLLRFFEVSPLCRATKIVPLVVTLIELLSRVPLMCG